MKPIAPTLRAKVRQFILPLADELIVDLFAGGGGASTGIEEAIGRHVDIAINHNPKAINQHQANHPQTTHYVSDVFEVDPLVVTNGRPVGLLWASPDCRHFSRAKGGKPVSKKVRSLAGVVIKWAKTLGDRKPRVICLENVVEFQTWGPLLADGKPCPERKGQTFERWVASLRRLGYAVEWRELRACDYDIPTIRKRFFLVARCDGQPIVWTKPTHGKPGSGLKPYRTAAECIDWSIPCPSIFGRKKPLAEATLRRIAHGIKRYVLDNPQPFLVHFTNGDGKPGGVKRWGTGAHAIDAPMPTLTTKAEHVLCVPTLISAGYGERPGQTPRVPGLDTPLGTVTAGGGHHALVAAYLAKHFGGEPAEGKTCTSLRKPMPTVTARDHSAVVAADLIKLHGTSNSAAVDEPLGTVTAGGTHHAAVYALLHAYYGTDQDTRLDDPLHTVTTKGRFALVTIHGEDFVIADIGMRMLKPRELYRAQGFPESFIIDRGADGAPLTQEDQVRCCGNNVPPGLARVVVAANYADQQQVRKAA